MASVNTGKQSVSYEIADLKTIPRSEYEHLVVKANASDEIIMAIIKSQKELNAMIKQISRSCKEVF